MLSQCQQQVPAVLRHSLSSYPSVCKILSSSRASTDEPTGKSLFDPFLHFRSANFKMALQSFHQEIEIVSAEVSSSLTQVRLKPRYIGLVLVDHISSLIRHSGSLFSPNPQQGASSVKCLCLLYTEIYSALVMSGLLSRPGWEQLTQ